MSTPGWPEDTKLRLRVLWAEGHSTAEIGRRLGVTKHAAISMAHRMDLAARPSPIVRDGQAQASTKRMPHPRATLAPLESTLASQPTAKQPLALAAAPPPVPPQAARPRGAADHGGCQWVETMKPLLQCGDPVFQRPTYDGGVRIHAWCARHWRIVYPSRSAPASEAVRAT